jgi:hypothetical protein
MSILQGARAERVLVDLSRARPWEGRQTENPLGLLEAGEAALQPAAALPLGPLAEAEAERAVQAGLPSADPFLRREIGRLAGGNPLYIEELCHQVRHAPLPMLPLAAVGLPLAADAQRPGGSWLRALIDMRVARLAPPARNLLAAAAVLGTQAPAAQVRRLAAQPPDDAVLAALAREDLLFFEAEAPDDAQASVRFKHGLTRDAVYESLALEDRRALHRAAAALLLDSAPGGDPRALCEPLALPSAGAGDAEAAAHWSEMAGDKAMATSALDRARAHYRAALHWLERQPAPPSATSAGAPWCGASGWLACSTPRAPTCRCCSGR